MLEAAQIQSFKDHGYLILPGFVGSDLVHAWREQFWAHIGGSIDKPDQWPDRVEGFAPDPVFGDPRDAYEVNSYLDLCHEDFQYTITTYSPELRKDILWLDHDKIGMKTLLDVLPLHASDHFLRLTMSRHLRGYTV